ncbi:MAG TPA: hypothetical protein VK658_07165 [Chryseolinea sp.]|nr:hypothetical protein [Chryseolinea sp.]
MSRIITVLFTAIALITTSAFAQEKGGPDKKIETILGTWKVQKILSGKTEVAKNPTSGQWIEFRNDGKYVNNATSVDSGSYRLNENHSLLYLESQLHASAVATGPKIVEWAISLSDDKLTMQQKTNESNKKGHADIMKYVYVRIEKGSNKLNN